MDVSRLLAATLENAAKMLRDGECNMTEDETEEILERLSVLMNNKYISKYETCKILRVSRATFDRLVRNRKIPHGVPQQGCHELFWRKSDIKKYLLSNISTRCSK